MYRLALWMLPVGLLGQALFGQVPDARELLRQSADAVRKYHSYQLESLIVVEMRGGPVLPKMELPSSISVRRPDKMRVESRGRDDGLTIVGDGEHTWYYLASTNKFIKREAATSPEATMNNLGLEPKNLPDGSKSIESVTPAGEETLSIAGREFPCWKISTTYKTIEMPREGTTIRDAQQTTWISKSEGLTLQSEFHSKIYLASAVLPINMTQSTHTTAVRLNVDLPDSLFTFTPPEGAEEAIDGSLPGLEKPDVIGKPAPAMNGIAVDLASMNGKIVLLDFATTWCAPCKREMASLEKLHRELRERGVVIIGMNVGENAPTVKDFVKRAGLTYPVVPVEEASDVVAKLAVTAYPTMVLIDREGKVASYEIGVRGEQGLREELAKLGVHSK